MSLLFPDRFEVSASPRHASPLAALEGPKEGVGSSTLAGEGADPLPLIIQALELTDGSAFTHRVDYQQYLIHLKGYADHAVANTEALAEQARGFQQRVVDLLHEVENEPWECRK